MSEEAFHIMTQMDLEGAETQAVLQCAPLLTGIKMSNLLHVREGQQREVASMFEATPVSSRILYKKNGRISVFLYREQRLKRFLSVGKVRRLLDSFGYRGMELPEILSRLSDRYQRHMDGRGEFPHEIGLLLGYPPEDVSGFIENGGKNFLCSGYWKVYKDPARARRIFDGYIINHRRKNQWIRSSSRTGHRQEIQRPWQRLWEKAWKQPGKRQMCVIFRRYPWTA